MGQVPSCRLHLSLPLGLLVPAEVGLMSATEYVCSAFLTEFYKEMKLQV